MKKFDDKTKKRFIRPRPWIAFMAIAMGLSQTAIFVASMQPEDRSSKTAINPQYIFKNINLPYKESCLASKYELPFPIANNIEELNKNGIYLKNHDNNDNDIRYTFSIVDCNDEEGTAIY